MATVAADEAGFLPAETRPYGPTEQASSLTKGSPDEGRGSKGVSPSSPFPPERLFCLAGVNGDRDG